MIHEISIKVESGSDFQDEVTMTALIAALWGVKTYAESRHKKNKVVFVVDGRTIDCNDAFKLAIHEVEHHDKN